MLDLVKAVPLLKTRPEDIAKRISYVLAPVLSELVKLAV